eukprot:20895-Heterococcus_DN1.PRE.9
MCTEQVMSREQIEEYFDKHECFICKRACRAKLAPRASLLQHFRASKCPKHIFFRETQWNEYIKRGGDHITREKTADEIKEAVEQVFPAFKGRIEIH